MLRFHKRITKRRSVSQELLCFMESCGKIWTCHCSVVFSNVIFIPCIEARTFSFEEKKIKTKAQGTTVKK
jgi:hypothetical protein